MSPRGASSPAPSGFSWRRTVGWGSVAALVGSAGYWSVLEITGYEVGILALLVGLLVGLGVRLGSSSRGGALLQLLAMSLTYLAIVATYVPDVAAELRRQEPSFERQEDPSPNQPRSIIERRLRRVTVETEPTGPVRAIFVFAGLVLSVPVLAVGAGNHGGWVFLLLGMIQAAVLNRRGATGGRRRGHRFSRRS